MRASKRQIQKALEERILDIIEGRYLQILRECDEDAGATTICNVLSRLLKAVNTRLREFTEAKGIDIRLTPNKFREIVKNDPYKRFRIAPFSSDQEGLHICNLADDGEEPPPADSQEIITTRGNAEEFARESMERKPERVLNRIHDLFETNRGAYQYPPALPVPWLLRRVSEHLHHIYPEINGKDITGAVKRATDLEIVIFSELEKMGISVRIPGGKPRAGTEIVVERRTLNRSAIAG